MLTRLLSASLLAAACVNAQSTSTVVGPLGRQADSVLQAAEQSGFSGVVRVDTGGTTILEKGYGKANRTSGALFTPTTVVQIGSNTKDFTLVALLQLQELKRLVLEDTLGKFFPDAPADKRGITLRQVVGHRAGLPMALGGDFEPVGREQLVARAMGTPLLFKPGSDERYSNPGYSLLAAIIETVTGQTYDEYVREHILVPLGLHDTGFLLPHFDTARLAHGYAGARDMGTMLAKRHAPDGPYWNLRGNGGMLSTVGDMHAFYKALFEGTGLMGAATRDPFFNSNQPIGLAGSDMVNFFLYERIPQRRVEVIFATSTGEAAARPIREGLHKVLGLRSGRREEDRASSAPSGKAPTPAVAGVLRDFVKSLNRGDTTALRQFIVDHFSNDAESPPVDERLERFLGMRERVGELSVSRMDLGDRDVVEVRAQGKNTGPLMLKFDIPPTAPYRIRSILVLDG